MKLKVTIENITTVNEFDFYWNNEDYIYLLNEFNFPDADKSKKEELLDLLFMAIGDFEPDEAARTLLNYKLGDKLNEGQILSISHEMLKDKVAEEYREPALHFDLFNINQLLFKAYNGTFPNTEASIIDLEITPLSEDDIKVDAEILIKALAPTLKSNNLIIRLFEDQITAIEAFTDAAKAVWKINNLGNNKYQLLSSKYWIDKDDFTQAEYEAELKFFVAEEE